MNFAFMRSCPPIITVVSSPLQTRLELCNICSETAEPSARPEIMVHSPCNFCKSESVGFLSSPRTLHSVSVVASSAKSRYGWVREFMFSGTLRVA